MKLTRTTVSLAAAGTLLATGPLALAASPHAAAPTGGKVNVYLSHFTNTTASIIFTGAIGDAGKAVTTDANGKTDGSGTYEHITLKHGTLVINAAPFNKALHSGPPTFNQANCSANETVSGSSKVVSGTGAYAGASGTIKLTAVVAGIAPRKDGKCDAKSNAGPYYFTITGSGSVSFK